MNASRTRRGLAAISAAIFLAFGLVSLTGMTSQAATTQLCAVPGTTTAASQFASLSNLVATTTTVSTDVTITAAPPQAVYLIVNGDTANAKSLGQTSIGQIGTFHITDLVLPSPASTTASTVYNWTVGDKFNTAIVVGKGTFTVPPVVCEEPTTTTTSTSTTTTTQPTTTSTSTTSTTSTSTTSTTSTTAPTTTSTTSTTKPTTTTSTTKPTTTTSTTAPTTTSTTAPTTTSTTVVTTTTTNPGTSTTSTTKAPSTTSTTKPTTTTTEAYSSSSTIVECEGEEHTEQQGDQQATVCGKEQNQPNNSGNNGGNSGGSNGSNNSGGSLPVTGGETESQTNWGLLLAGAGFILVIFAALNKRFQWIGKF